ncbi:unnamed protein product [Phaeothamnion confervicola]
MSAMYFRRATCLEPRLSTPWHLRLEWVLWPNRRGKQTLCPATQAARRVFIPPVFIWCHPGPAAFPELKWRLVLCKLPLTESLHHVEDQSCASCGPAASIEAVKHAFTDCRLATASWGPGAAGVVDFS